MVKSLFLSKQSLHIPDDGQNRNILLWQEIMLKQQYGVDGRFGADYFHRGKAMLLKDSHKDQVTTL